MSDAQMNIKIGADVAGAVSGLNQVAGATTKTTAALGKLPNVSNQSTQALSNLSRVAQDAPYGFIGIANNLNPLVESFQRLKVSTGSTGGAIKELGKSMTGAGGIGLAVGVVSSLLVVFADKLFGASKASKEAEEANKKLGESIAGDIVKLTSLVAIIQNVNASREDQKKALQAVNQDYSKYLPNLEKEKVTLDNIASSYDRIVDAILRQAVVKGLQDEIEKAVSKTAASIIALEKTEVKRGQTTTQTARTEISAVDAAAKKFQQFNQVKRDGVLASIENQKQVVQEVQGLNNYETALNRLKGQLKKDLSPLFDIIKNFSFEDLDTKLNKVNITPDKVEIRKPTGGLKFADDFNFDTAALFNLGKRLRGKIIVAPKFDMTGGEGPDRGPSEVDPLIAATEQANALGEMIIGFVTPAFDTMFATIAKGGNVFKAFGQAIIQSLVQVITKLITTVALAGILAAVTGGGSVLAAGFKGAQGFGEIFGKLMFGRAGGGPVSAGLPYMVGENRPEIFIPETSGRIVAAGSGSISQGQISVQVSGQLVGSGNSLIAVISGATRSQNRLG